MAESPNAPHDFRRATGRRYAVLLAISVAVFQHALLSGRVAHHRGQDDLELTIPYAQALWRAIAARESPWWLPWIDAGTSAFAHFPYLGPFYPAVLAFVGGDPLRALDGVLLAHVALAAFGVRAWVRALGGSQVAGLIAGVVLAGSSVWQVAAHEGYATEAPVWTWLPWVFAALERARTGEPLRHGALAALAAGLLALGGHATDLYVGALASAVYLLGRLATLRGAPEEAGRLAQASIVAGVLGTGIGLAFWLPALGTVDLSSLARERVAKAAIPHPMLRLVRPGEGFGTKDALYVGLVTLAWIANALRGSTRRVAWPLTSVAVLALALSFGPGTLLWRALGVVPGFAALDQGNVFSWPFALFAAALAGLGAAPGGAGAPRRRRWIGRVAVILLLADLTGYALRRPPADTDPAAEGRRLEALGAPDRCALGGGPAPAAPTRILVIERWAPEAELRWWRNDALRLGCIEDARASAHLGSPRLRRVLRALGPWPIDWDTFSDDRARAPAALELSEGSPATRVLDLLSVGIVVTDVNVVGDAFRAQAASGSLATWARREPVPRYRLVLHSEVVGGEDAAAERVLAPTFDPRTSAILAEGTGGEPHPSAPGSADDAGHEPAPVVVEHYRAGDILLRTRSRPGELLVVGETWFRGWRATVDGRPTPLVRANYLHMALAPPPGQHEIRLIYSPAGLGLGWTVAATSVVVAVALLGRSDRRRAP